MFNHPFAVDCNAVTHRKIQRERLGFLSGVFPKKTLIFQNFICFAIVNMVLDVLSLVMSCISAALSLYVIFLLKGGRKK
jgi:hypothetical protein